MIHQMIIAPGYTHNMEVDEPKIIARGMAEAYDSAELEARPAIFQAIVLKSRLRPIRQLLCPNRLI